MTVAAFNADFLFYMLIAGGAAVVGLWAVLRPKMVRDNHGRMLRPSVMASVIFTLLSILSYLTLTVAFLVGAPFVAHAFHITGFRATFFDRVGPEFSLLFLYGLYALPPFRRLERAVVIWLHGGALKQGQPNERG